MEFHSINKVVMPVMLHTYTLAATRQLFFFWSAMVAGGRRGEGRWPCKVEDVLGVGGVCNRCNNFEVTT
jgi:hypothetical protein